MRIVDEALKDWTVWAIVIISFTNALPTGGLGAFSNIILTEFVRPITVYMSFPAINRRFSGVYSVTNILIGHCSRSGHSIVIDVC